MKEMDRGEAGIKRKLMGKNPYISNFVQVVKGYTGFGYMVYPISLVSFRWTMVH